MTQTSNEVIKLFKSRINILELQKTRGFNTEPYDGFNLSEVNTMHSSDQMDMLLDNENSDRKVYIKYQIKKKLTVNNINEIIEHKTIDLIYQPKITERQRNQKLKGWKEAIKKI